MRTLTLPQALRSIVQTKASKINCDKIRERNICSNFEVGVFSSHRDVKVAIEDLLEAGIKSDRFILIARNWQDRDWLKDLTIDNYFDEQLFYTNSIGHYYFQKLFRRGKYLLLVTGISHDKNSAGAIMSRRRGYAKVWRFENNILNKII